jgi:GntR family transcriptional regulator
MTTRTEEIAEHYRALIRDGKLQPNKRLPSSRDMAREHGVSEPTARMAVGWLRAEGYITTTQRGSYVSQRPGGVDSPQDRLRRAVRLGSTFAERETQRVLKAELVVPPAYVAEAYDIEPGDQVVRREYVIGTGQHRLALHVDWYPAPFAAMVPELLSTAARSGGDLLTLIEGAAGRTASHGRDAVRGRAADAREANHLGLPVGSPVLAGAHAWSDDAGLIVYGEWVLPPDLEVGFSYDLDRGTA